MKVMVSVNHPAWAHQFHPIVERLRARGDEVMTLLVEKDGATELLKSYGIPYVLCADGTGKNVWEKGWLFLRLCVVYTRRALRFRPDILIGRASPMMAVAAWVCRRPHLIYEDTEVSRFSLRICKRLSTRILTPRTFLTDLGPRQVRVDTYKELFYLHPSVFAPDKALLGSVGFDADEPYVLVRFVAWNASHDVGKHGLSDREQLSLVERLSAAGVRVWVSSEKPLSPQLEPYRLRTPFALAHHVLAFARLVYSEGATMASEAAVLGVHALYVNVIQSGSTREQSERYHLLYNFNEGDDRYERALAKALELLGDPDLIEAGREKRAKLLAEKTDINDFYIAEMDRLARVGRKG
jgi:predicted glycosyltransferase